MHLGQLALHIILSLQGPLARTYHDARARARTLEVYDELIRRLRQSHSDLSAIQRKIENVRRTIWAAIALRQDDEMET